jgi:hypothetical protein
MSARKWTEEEVNFLKENIGKLPYSQMCQKLNRSGYSVRSKASSLGLTLDNIQARGSLNYKWTGYEEITGNFFYSMRKRAKKSNIPFDITIEYIWDLYLKQDKKCALSGVDISFSIDRHKNKSDQTASLDRIDSSKGYVEGNLQWVHKTVNAIKWHLGEEEFFWWCKTISERN